MKIVKFKFEVDKGTIMPINSVNYDPEFLITETLVWKSVTPEIVGINANTGEFCAIKCGTGSIIGKDELGNIRVYCVINVKDTVTIKKTSATKNNAFSIEPTSRMYSNWYGNSYTDTIISMGYSGEIYQYTQDGNWVRLEMGINTKTGQINDASVYFRSELITMNNIYSSLSPLQRDAWYILKALDYIQIIVDIITLGSISELDVVISIVEGVLANNGINLGDSLRRTLFDFGDWYVAEKNAESYFCEF